MCHQKHDKCIILKMMYFSIAPPTFDRGIKDQAVERGEQLKVKIPFSGTGPFDFVLKHNGKVVPSNNRLKLTPFDDYVTVQLSDADLDDSGKYTVEIANDSGVAQCAFGVKVQGNDGYINLPVLHLCLLVKLM